MIKAEELRIGNFLLNTGNGQEFRVSFDVLELIHRKRGWFYRIEPIPLTEEWFKKLGFNWDEDDGWNISYLSIQEGDYRLCVMDDEAEVEFNSYKPSYSYQHVFVGHVEHVHQLQNLYFALTGEELELSKP